MAIKGYIRRLSQIFNRKSNQESLRELRLIEIEIIREWGLLYEDIKKDLANVWYDRSRREIKEIYKNLERLKNSRQFVDFLKSINRKKNVKVLDELISLLDVDEIDKLGTNWYKKVFIRLNAVLKVLHDEIKLLEDFVFRIEIAKVQQADSIAALLKENYRYVNEYPEEFIRTLRHPEWFELPHSDPEFLRYKLRSGEYVGFVALNNTNRVVGFSAIKCPPQSGYYKDFQIGEFGSMVTDKDFRNKGIAGMLSKARTKFAESSRKYLFLTSKLVTVHDYTQRTNRDFVPTCFEFYNTPSSELGIGQDIFMAFLNVFKDNKNGFIKKSKSSIFIPDYHTQFFRVVYYSLKCKRKMITTSINDINKAIIGFNNLSFQRNISGYSKSDKESTPHIKFHFLRQNLDLGEFNMVKLSDPIAPLLMNSFETCGQYFCGILPMISLDGRTRSDYALYMDVPRQSPIPYDQIKVYLPLSKYIKDYVIRRPYRQLL